jgi:hypothetical protein
MFLPFFTFLGIVLGIIATALGDVSVSPMSTSATVMCYLNGDNDLSREVLHALDMLETAGSTKDVNVVALVDGHPAWLGPYSLDWARTRLVHVELDTNIGEIKSTVLAEWGEADLGSSETLERFIRESIARYPADRFIFYTFAHSQGIIDTGRLSIRQPGKRLSISPDETNQAKMNIEEFHTSIRRGLAGHHFDLMVLFSCLANMVEVGYALSDVTDYVVASQDEIRLLNEHSGNAQFCGLDLETAIVKLIQHPGTDTQTLSRIIIDSYVQNYRHDDGLTADDSKADVCLFPAGMALVDCKALTRLVRELDKLSEVMIAQSNDPLVQYAVRQAIQHTPRFASFLNLEYYDLQLLISNLRDHFQQRELIQACNETIDVLSGQVLLYERHTLHNNITGMSVYLSNPLVPDNIFAAHQTMYLQSRFSQDTHWDEMIDCFRERLKR